MTWLRDRRAAVMAQYDDEAPTYDDDPYPTTSHGQFVERLLETCPADGLVLVPRAGRASTSP